MTALTADRSTPYRGTEILSLQVAANAKIYAGSQVCVNATGYATPGATATTLTYMGRAESAVDNTGGADGAVSVVVRRKTSFKWANYASDLVTQACIGQTVYIVDDQTVAKTSGSSTRSAGGKCVGIDADGVWVE